MRDIKLWLAWRATSESATSSMSVPWQTEAVPLSISTRALGGRARPTFSLKIPRDQPPTYKGPHLAIEWFVVAGADIAWARDPRVEVPIYVGPAEHPRTQPKKLTVLGPRLLKWRASPLANTLGIVGVGVSTTAITAVTGGLAATAVGLGVVGVYALYHGLSAKKVRQLGPPSLVTDPGDLVLGEPWKLRLVVKPTVDIGRLEATYAISLEERVTFGSGKTQHTEVHVRWASQKPLASAMTILPSGKEAFFDVTATTPETLPPTFDQPRQHLVWKLAISIAYTPVGGELTKLEYVVPIVASR